jgi:ribosomal protein S27E
MFDIYDYEGMSNITVECYRCETKQDHDVPFAEGRYEYKCHKCGAIKVVIVDSQGNAIV